MTALLKLNYEETREGFSSPGSSEVFTLRVTAHCTGKGIQVDKKSFGSPSKADFAFEINSFLISTHLGFPGPNIIFITQRPFWKAFSHAVRVLCNSSLHNVTLFHIYRITGPDEKGKINKSHDSARAEAGQQCIGKGSSVDRQVHVIVRAFLP